jgi:hypothetical protein
MGEEGSFLKGASLEIRQDWEKIERLRFDHGHRGNEPNEFGRD